MKKESRCAIKACLKLKKLNCDLIEEFWWRFKVLKLGDHRLFSKTTTQAVKICLWTSEVSKESLAVLVRIQNAKKIAEASA